MRDLTPFTLFVTVVLLGMTILMQHTAITHLENRVTILEQRR